MFYGLWLLQHVRMVMDLDINLLQLNLRRVPYQRINMHRLHLQFHAFSPNLRLVSKQRNLLLSFWVCILMLFGEHLRN